MNRRTTTIALAAILFPSVCFAWGRDGHRITGYIAAKYLTPQAAAAVKDLLGDQTLADASTWADEIKRDQNEEINKTDVLYVIYGYLEGGNHQIHPPIPGDHNCHGGGN